MDMMLDIIRPDNKSANNIPDNPDDKNDDQYLEDAKLEHKVKKKSLDELVVVASAFNLLSAGYDTASIALSFLGHQLALNFGLDIYKK